MHIYTWTHIHVDITINKQNKNVKCIIVLFVTLSKLPYEVTVEQALSHEEVRDRLEASNQTLRTVTDKVLNSIMSSVDTIP